MSRKPEILAPAGDLAALKAALLGGADAVYFGLSEGFNARARAANFTLATLRDTVARVHRAGARAYLTLNTLVFEPELARMEQVLYAAARAGIDALIIQDPAVCLLARAICPSLELHGSTQMTIADSDAARFARELGITRVVLPRELSVREIRELAAGSDLELEVFVHGALCVSWSGQCLSSEAWGGRSANRGQCAQSCRLPYGLVVDGQARDLGDVEYLLSPKDLAGARAVPELVQLGVHGLKIEGRQKGPQYVATAVAGYRRWLDAVVSGADRTEAEARLRGDLLDMSLSYTRGFGDGFLAGSDHQTLVEGRFPKHRGVLVGEVVEVHADAVVVETARAERPWTGAMAAAEHPAAPAGAVSSPLPGCGGAAAAASGPAAAALELRPGLGVVFDAGHPEDKQEPGGPVFSVERRGTRLRVGFGQPGPDLARVAAGQRMWATSDPALARGTERLLEQDEPEGRIPVALHVAGSAGAPLVARLAAPMAQVEARSAAGLAPARGAGMGVDVLTGKLGAFGGTPFRLAGLHTVGLQAGLHLPVSELKALRRALVAELRSALERGPEREVAPAGALRRLRPTRTGSAPQDAVALVPMCRSAAQLEAVIAAGLPEVELDWMELLGLARGVERARSAGLRVTIATLRVQKPGEASYEDRIGRLRPDGVLVRHWGAFMRFRRDAARPVLHGDFSLNVTNSITADWLLGRGLTTVTTAYDLDQHQLFALIDQAPAGRLAVTVYHRIPTFHTEHCVYAHLLSNGRDFRTCGRPCERHEVSLRDRVGLVHPVIVDAGCRNTVFNGVLQSAATLVPRLLAAGVRRLRVEFVRETREQAALVLGTFQELLAGRAAPEACAARVGAEERFGVTAGRMELMV